MYQPPEIERKRKKYHLRTILELSVVEEHDGSIGAPAHARAAREREADGIVERHAERLVCYGKMK